MEASQFKGELVGEENLDSSWHVCIFLQHACFQTKEYRMPASIIQCERGMWHVVLVGEGYASNKGWSKPEDKNQGLTARPAYIFVSSISIAI